MFFDRELLFWQSDIFFLDTDFEWGKRTQPTARQSHTNLYKLEMPDSEMANPDHTRSFVVKWFKKSLEDLEEYPWKQHKQNSTRRSNHGYEHIHTEGISN